MAEQPASDRTEKPTSDRLRKARREGQVPVSNEVGSAMTVGLLVLMAALGAPSLCRWVLGQAAGAMTRPVNGHVGPETLAAALTDSARATLIVMIPFLLAGAGVSVLASVTVSGWSYAPRHVNLNFNRIHPAQGFKGLFNWSAVARMIVAVAKLALILIVVYLYLKGRVGEVLALRHASPGGLLVASGRLVIGALWRMALVMGGVAVGDALFQRWKYLRDLRMTRQEVREEIKEHELNPQVRGRIRSLQAQMSRRRMMRNVPTADVVVTNPTHVAVALKYDNLTMEAPIVVAKGADLLAEKIRQIALEHGVPVVSRPPLARTLYQAVEIGQAIPENLFVAIAEILAMIYRLRRRRTGPAGSGEGKDVR